MKKTPPILLRLLHNGGWKLASVIIALLVWFSVTNYNDPVTTISFYNIPVNLINTDVILDNGKVFQVLENTDIIPKVSITASRSVAESFTRDDITATADLHELTSRDMVPIHITLKKRQSEVQNIAKSVDDVLLEIEESKSRTVSLQVQTKGVLADGYIVGDTQAAQNLVRLSGAATKVDRVVRAVAEVDVTGFVSEIATIADIRLYDENDNLVQDNGIMQNISTVSIKVQILKTKTVPIKVEYSGKPAEGYMVTDVITTSPAAVMIAGAEDAVDMVDEIILRGEELDISGLREDLRISIRLKDYLAADIRPVQAQGSGMVSVTIGIQELVRRELRMDASEVMLLNMPAGLTYEPVPEETVTVTISGLKDTADALTPGDLTLTADVGEALLGFDGEIPQTITLPVMVQQAPNGIVIEAVTQLTLVDTTENTD